MRAKEAPTLPLPRERGREKSSGGPVVDVDSSIRRSHVGSKPSSKLRAHPVKAPAEPVGIALHNVFQGEVGQLAPGETLQQIPGGALGEVPGVRPERAPAVAMVLVGVSG